MFRHSKGNKNRGKNSKNEDEKTLETEKLVEAREEFKDSPMKATLDFLFPYFKLKSVTVIYIALCILVYIFQWVLYRKYDWTCVLFKCGSKYLPVIQRHLHLFRLLLPVFLHITVWHLLWNMCALLLLGNSSEHFFGYSNFLVLLFLSGVSGNLMSSAFGEKCGIAVGASTCIMGILGKFEYSSK